MQPAGPHQHWHVDVSCINVDGTFYFLTSVLDGFRISDNGCQFTARDCKHFVRLLGITHVRTSPYYPQSNGKLERWHGSLKQKCLRPACPATIDDARRRAADYVNRYNHTRLHSAIGYVTPADKLNGLEQQIFNERDRKLEEAHERRALSRQAVA